MLNTFRIHLDTLIKFSKNVDILQKKKDFLITFFKFIGNFEYVKKNENLLDFHAHLNDKQNSKKKKR